MSATYFRTNEGDIVVIIDKGTIYVQKETDDYPHRRESYLNKVLSHTTIPDYLDFLEGLIKTEDYTKWGAMSLEDYTSMVSGFDRITWLAKVSA